MNPDLPILTPKEKQLEEELLSYVPRTPSADLKARIRAAAAELKDQPAASLPPLPPVEPKKIVRFSIFQPLVTIAALIMVGVFGVLIWQQSHPNSNREDLVKGTPTAPPTGANPDELLMWNNAPRVEGAPPEARDRVLVSQQNDGVVTGEDGQPKWKLRYKFLNRAVWEDPETGEKHKIVIPAEEEVLVPVHHD